MRITLPATTLWLRAAMWLGPVLAVQLGAVGGSPPTIPVLLAVAVMSGLFALRPDAWFGTVASVIVVIWWAQAFAGDLPWAVLPATLALTASHVAGLLADLGPSRMRLDVDVRRLWVRRGALACLAAAVLWFVAYAVDDTEAPGLWVVALVAGTVAAAAVAAVLARAGQT